MSFPVSPVNGQYAVVNNVNYVFSASNNAWRRSPGTITSINISGTTSATSTTTGALIVAGGAGIGGSMYVGGNITVAGTINASITGVSTTATNIASGTAGQLHYQSAPGVTAFAGPGTAGQLLVSAGASAPVYTNTSSIYVADAVTSTNLRAGTAGQLHYQSAANTSGFISTATTGNFLQANYVGAPTWTTTGSMYVGNSAKVDTVLQTANASYYPTFVSTNNASAAAMSVYTTSSLVINPATGYVGIGGTPSYKLDITNNGGAAPPTYITRFSSVSSTFGSTNESNAVLLITGQNGSNVRSVSIGIGVPATYGAHDVGFITLGASSMWNNTDGTWKWSTSGATTNQGTNYKGYEWYNNASDNQNAFTYYHAITSGGGSTFKIYSAKTSNTSTSVLDITSALGANFQINNAGNVGIGTATPGARLEVLGNGDPAFNTIALKVGLANYATSTSAQQYGIYVDQKGGRYAPQTGLFVNVNNPNGIYGGPYYGIDTYVVSSAQAYQKAYGVSGTAENTSANYGTQAYGVKGLGLSSTGTGATIVANAQGAWGGHFTAYGNGNSVGVYADAYLGSSPISGAVAIPLMVASNSVEKLRVTTNGGISFGASGTAYGTSGQILQSNGNAAPTWVDASGVTAGTATSATTVNTIAQSANASYYPTFVDSNNATATAEVVYTTSSFAINPSTGNIIITSNTPTSSTATGALQVVNGGVGIGGGLFVGGTVTSTNHIITGSAAVSNSGGAAQGALQVTGGVGVGGNILTTGYVYTANLQETQNNGLQIYVPYNSINPAISFYGGTGSKLVVNTSALSLAPSIAGGYSLGTAALPFGSTYVSSATISSSFISTSTTTGALTVTGGAGIGGNLNIGGTLNVANATSATSTQTGALTVTGGAGIGKNLYVGGSIYATSIIQTGIPLVLNDISNQADGLKAVFPLVVDQTAVTGIVDNKDLQVIVNGRIIPPYVTEKTYPWINTFINNKGFSVVTTGTTQNWLVIYNAPDIGSQVSVAQLNISTSKQTRSYPYSATTIALGD